MSTKAKEKAKKERRRAVAYADRFFSLYIRERDNNTSIISGVNDSQDVIQCGHVFTRASYSTRWDEENAFAVTRGENAYHEHDPWPMFRKVIEMKGREWFDELYRRHKETRKFSTEEIREIGQEYRRKYQLLLDRETFATLGKHSDISMFKEATL